jgi:hypothetical protein
MRGEQVHLTYIAPIYWRTKSSSAYRQSVQTKPFLQSKLVRYACCKFGQHSHLTKGHRSVYKLTGRLFQSLRLFRSFRISGHNTVFRSFQLSGRSGFPVVPAFRSFQLSGPFGYSRVVLVTENKIN